MAVVEDPEVVEPEETRSCCILKVFLARGRAGADFELETVGDMGSGTREPVSMSRIRCELTGRRLVDTVVCFVARLAHGCRWQAEHGRSRVGLGRALQGALDGRRGFRRGCTQQVSQQARHLTK